jgi:hypothetical protein
MTAKTGQPKSWDEVQPGDTVQIYSKRLKVTAVNEPGPLHPGVSESYRQTHEARRVLEGYWVKNDGTPAKIGNNNSAVKGAPGGYGTRTAVDLDGIEFTPATIAPVKRTDTVPPPVNRPTTGNYPGLITYDDKGRTSFTDEQTKHLKMLTMAVRTGGEANAMGYHMVPGRQAQVGDEVMVDTFARLRRGVVTKTTKNGSGTARVAYVTPSGGYVQEANTDVGGLFHLTEPDKRPRESHAAALPKLAPEARAPRLTEADRTAAKEARKAAEKARSAASTQRFFDDKIKGVTASLTGENSNPPEWHLNMTTEAGLVSLAKHLGVKVANRKSYTNGYIGGTRPRNREEVDVIRQDIIKAIRERLGKA